MNDSNSGSTSSLPEITQQIEETERKLQDLHRQYEHVTGSAYIPPVAKSQWKWTLLLTIGFAFISCMVYLIGIRKSGRTEEILPEFMFSVDVQYYLFLTFYFLLAVIIPQIKQLKGYQIIQIFFGFWCFHWLVYDWWWWAYEIGVGHVENLPEFWNELFYSPLLIPEPPMWLFFTEALLGTGVGVYTILVPKSNRDLIPTLVYLYTVYMNASVGLVLGFTTPVILTIGIALIGFVYGFMIWTIKRNMIWKKWKDGRAQPSEADTLVPTTKLDRLLSFDVSVSPWNYVSIGCILSFHVITLLSPGFGTLFALLPWYFIPVLFFARNMIYQNEWSKTKKQRMYLAVLLLLVLAGAFFVLISNLDIV